MQNSPMGRVPGEIRNLIYWYILYEPSTIELRTHYRNRALKRSDPSVTPWKNQNHGSSQLPRLSAVCRQMHAEIRGYYFKINDLTIHSDHFSDYSHKDEDGQPWRKSHVPISEPSPADLDPFGCGHAVYGHDTCNGSFACQNFMSWSKSIGDPSSIARPRSVNFYIGNIDDDGDPLPYYLPDREEIKDAIEVFDPDVQIRMLVGQCDDPSADGSCDATCCSLVIASGRRDDILRQLDEMARAEREIQGAYRESLVEAPTRKFVPAPVSYWLCSFGGHQSPLEREDVVPLSKMMRYLYTPN